MMSPIAVGAEDPLVASRATLSQQFERIFDAMIASQLLFLQSLASRPLTYAAIGTYFPYRSLGNNGDPFRADWLNLLVRCLLVDGTANPSSLKVGQRGVDLTTMPPAGSDLRPSRARGKRLILRTHQTDHFGRNVVRDNCVPFKIRDEKLYTDIIFASR